MAAVKNSFFIFSVFFIRLFNYNLLRFRVIAIAEAHHINACAQVEALAVAALDTIAAQDAAGDVYPR